MLLYHIMLPYDIQKELFPGKSNADLKRTIEKAVTLQAYKSEIRIPPEPVYLDVSSPEYEEMSAGQQPPDLVEYTTPGVQPPQPRAGLQHRDATSFARFISGNNNIVGPARRPSQVPAA